MLLMGTHIISSFTPTEVIYWMRSWRFPKTDGCIRSDSLKYVKEEFKYRQTQTVYKYISCVWLYLHVILLCCKQHSGIIKLLMYTPTQHVPHKACPTSGCYYTSNYEQELPCPIINSQIMIILKYVHGFNTAVTEFFFNAYVLSHFTNNKKVMRQIIQQEKDIY
jgi:hypothetical protein